MLRSDLDSRALLPLQDISMKKQIEHLKQKWGIKSNWDFIAICIVFSIAGSFIGYERRPIFAFLGITQHTALWIKIAVYIPLIFPLYQLNLIVFSLPLRQFPFFWEKEKRLARAIGRLFTPKITQKT